MAEVTGEQDALDISQVLLMLVAMPLGLVWFASVLWWIYDAWESVPEAHREAPLLGRVQPAVAMLLFFIPCFNLVWMFLNNLGLAESMNRALAAQGSTTRVNTGLVIAACIFQIIPYCNG